MVLKFKKKTVVLESKNPTNMSTQQQLAEIKKYGYNIDFSDIFNKSLETYKKIALLAGVVLILFSVVVLSIVFGAMTVFMGVSVFSGNIADFNISGLSIVTVLIYIFGVSLLSGFVSPFTAGLLKMAHNAFHHLDFSVGTAFEYYKSSYFKELFTASVLIAFITISFSALLERFHVPFVGGLITYLISFFTFLTIPFIIFGNLKAIEAIQASFIVVSKQFFVLLGLIIIAIIMACLGLFGFCIGIFFTIPFLYAMHYCIYNEIIGTGYKSELDEIGASPE